MKDTQSTLTATTTATNEPCPFCGATETNPECVNCRLGAYLTGEASDYSPEHYGITTLYGFSSANAYDEPAGFTRGRQLRGSPPPAAQDGQSRKPTPRT